MSIDKFMDDLESGQKEYINNDSIIEDHMIRSIFEEYIEAIRRFSDGTIEVYYKPNGMFWAKLSEDVETPVEIPILGHSKNGYTLLKWEKLKIEHLIGFSFPKMLGDSSNPEGLRKLLSQSLKSKILAEFIYKAKKQ